MNFEPVDLTKNLNLCLAFRRDAHLLSYGSEQDFNQEECLQWFKALTADNNCRFEHVLFDDKIIGQLEYKSNILQKDGTLVGYINLFYLLPEYRGQGLGRKLESYVLSNLLSDGCTWAYLRYLPANIVAGAFYHKQGWLPQGAVSQRGQLMAKCLA